MHIGDFGRMGIVLSGAVAIVSEITTETAP